MAALCHQPADFRDRIVEGPDHRSVDPVRGFLQALGERAAVDIDCRDARSNGILSQRPAPHLCWSEHGGPTVTPPTRRGFGSKLIERALSETLDGGVTLSFDPAGLICTVEAHLSSAQRDARN